MSQLNTRIVLRNDSSVNYANALDLVLLKGEVGFEFTEAGKVKMKIGDGIKTWQELDYFGGEELNGDGASIVVADQKISIAGFADAAAGARLTKGEDGALVWEVPDTSTVEDLAARVTALESKISTVYNFKGSVDNYSDLPSSAEVGDVYNIRNSSFINGISAGDNVAWTGSEWDKLAGIVDLSGYATTEEVEVKIDEVEEKISKYTSRTYEVVKTPEGTLVDYFDKEIRIMVPSTTDFANLNNGINGAENLRYIECRVYAPEGATKYKFTFGGISGEGSVEDWSGLVDDFGRHYIVTAPPIAHYNTETATWTYYGVNSTTKHYVGWDHISEWFDENGVKIASNSIRINLSNEECHDVVEPYYMGSINVNKLMQNEDEFLILYGGSASDNI